MTTPISKAPLEDLMAAMDVVDTLRHQQDIVERELNDDARRQNLLERLRQLYQAQGLEVPDHVLLEGIEALEEERFKYKPIPASWRSRLANVWVSRSRWGKPVTFLLVLAGLFSSIYWYTDVLPARRALNVLPIQLQNSTVNIQSVALNNNVSEQAKQEYRRGMLAIEQKRFDDAQNILQGLQDLERAIQLEYTIRIVSRKGERSGVFRVPEVNQNAKNYYLIVEAVGSDNRVLAIDVLDEETNTQKRLKAWGLRVNEQIYNRVAQDKRDDGIIQNNQVGQKTLGFLKPKFTVPTTGATIVSW